MQNVAVEQCCRCGTEMVPFEVTGKLVGVECPKCGRGCTYTFTREDIEKHYGISLPSWAQ